MSEGIPTAEDSAPAAPHPLEWVPVGLEGLFLGLLALRPLGLDLMPGQLLPCLALGLAPGSAMRLTGRPSITTHRCGIALGLIAFLLTNGSIDLERLTSLPAAWRSVLPALALVLLTPVLGAMRWRTLLVAQGIPMTYGEALRLTYVGHFFSTFIPGSTGGDVVRVYYVARGSGRTGAAFGSVLLDRFMGLPPLLLLVVIGAFANRDFLATSEAFRPYLWLITVATGLSGLLAALLLLTALLRPERTASWVEHLPVGKQLGLLIRGLATFRRHGMALLSAFGYGLAGHVVILTACILLGDPAGVREVPAERYLLLAPIGLAVNAIPASPGGLGQGEAAFAKVFHAASPLEGNAAAGALVMLVLRLGWVLCGLIGGGLYMAGRHAIDEVRQRAMQEGARPASAGDTA